MRATKNIPLLLSPSLAICRAQLTRKSAARVPKMCSRRRIAAESAGQRSRAASGLLALFIALAGSLAGCATPFHWIKDGFSAQHAEAKFAACQLEAERLRYVASESDEEREARTRHEAGLCMKADGWRWTQADGESESGSSSGSASEGPANRSGGRGADPDHTQSVSAAARRPGAPDAETGSEGAEAKTAAAPDERESSDGSGAKEEDDEEDDDEEE